MTPATATAAVRPAADPWLGGVMQRAVYRLNVAEATLRSPDEVRPVLATLGPGPVFAYAKVSTSALAAMAALTGAGFCVVDVNVQLEKPIGPAADAAPPGVRLAAPADETAVLSVAERGFRYSRFHLDPQLPAAVANAVKREWVRSFFTGARGDHMVVGEEGGGIAGFNLLLKGPDHRLTIDLIAVDERARRKGLASRMIACAERLPGYHTIRVGTQLANTPSIQLYERLGFRVQDASYVLHYHRPGGA